MKRLYILTGFLALFSLYLVNGQENRSMKPETTDTKNIIASETSVKPIK